MGLWLSEVLLSPEAFFCDFSDFSRENLLGNVSETRKIYFVLRTSEVLSSKPPIQLHQLIFLGKSSKSWQIVRAEELSKSSKPQPQS